MAQGDCDPAWMAKLNADYDTHDPLVYRATWAEENSAASIPDQIASWRREAAERAKDVTNETWTSPRRGQNSAWIRVKLMHCVADQMEYLWRQLAAEAQRLLRQKQQLNRPALTQPAAGEHSDENRDAPPPAA